MEKTVEGGDYHVVSSVIIYPPRFSGHIKTEEQQFGHSYGHTYLLNGTTVPFARRWRDDTSWWKGQDFPEHYQKELKQAFHRSSNAYKYGKRIYYGGFLNGHFGHFLVETMTRMWLLLYQPVDTIILFCINSSDKCHVSLQNYLSALKYTLQPGSPQPKVVLLSLPTFFPQPQVFVPRSIFWVEGLEFSPVGKNLFQTISYHAGQNALTKKFKTYKNIYLLRDNQFRTDHKFKNEKELASMLQKKFDFQTIVPEDYTFEEQLYLYSSCDTLMSRFGTATHNALFMKENSTLIILEDGRPVNHVQHKIQKIKNQKFFTIPLHTMEEDKETMELDDYEKDMFSLSHLNVK